MSFFNDNGENQSTEQQANQGEEAQTEDFLAKIVAEKGEKWQDPKELAKGYWNSQQYIQQLEQQAAELREDLGKKTYADEILRKLQEGQAPTTQEPPKKPEQSGTTEEQNTTAELSEDKLESLIEQTLTQREKKRTSAQNLEAADARLTELYGTEANKIMEEKGKELGMSKERLTEIASESPTAFFRLIGEDGPSQETNSLPKSSVNTSTGFEAKSDRRDFSYYQKMRREKPNLYYSPKIQQQMLEDRLKMGDKF